MWPKNFICFWNMSSVTVCLRSSVWRISSFLILSRRVTPMIFLRHIISTTRRRNSSSSSESKFWPHIKEWTALGPCTVLAWWHAGCPLQSRLVGVSGLHPVLYQFYVSHPLYKFLCLIWCLPGIQIIAHTWHIL